MKGLPIDSLCDMGFTPLKGELDVWMHQNGNMYEYIAVYVDGLEITARKL